MNKAEIHRLSFPALLFACLLLSALCLTCARVIANPLDPALQLQREQGFADNTGELKAAYAALCNRRAFSIQGMEKSALCDHAANILLNASRQRQITLEHFQQLAINNCVIDDGYEREECEEYIQIIPAVVETALALGLCHYPGVVVFHEDENDRVMLRKRGDNVYEDLELTVECSTGFVENTSENMFLTNPGIPYEENFPIIIEQLHNDIGDNDLDRFKRRLTALNTELEQDRNIIAQMLGAATEPEGVAFLQALLEKGNGIDVNIVGDTGNGYFHQPLSVALENNNAAAAKLLLKHNARPDIPYTNGTTPLTQAAAKGYLAVVLSLLDAGASVHGQSKELWTARRPVIEAAEYGHLEIVRHLFARGADVSVQQSEAGQPPLIAAARSGNSEIVRIFIEHGATLPGTTLPRTTEEIEQIAQALIAGGNASIMQTYQSMGLSIPAAASEDILYALQKRVSNLSKASEHNPVKPCDCTALLTQFLEAGVKIDHKADSAARFAKTAMSHYEEARYARASSEPQRQQSAIPAARYSKAAMLAALNTGMNVNHQGSNGETLLMQAANRGIPDFTGLLLQRGADPALTNDDGKTAKDMAVSKAKRLIKNKVLTNEYLNADVGKTVALLGGITQ